MASGARKAKAAEYRQSDKGRTARRAYNQQPEVKAHRKMIRDMKRKAKGGY